MLTVSSPTPHYSNKPYYNKMLSTNIVSFVLLGV